MNLDKTENNLKEDQHNAENTRNTNKYWDEIKHIKHVAEDEPEKLKG